MEKNKKEQTNLHSQYYLTECVSPETNRIEGKQNKESKPVASRTRIFSAEKVIPISYDKRRYFDFKSYIDFLYRERRRARNTSGTHSAKQHKVQGATSETESKFKNTAEILVSSF